MHEERKYRSGWAETLSGGTEYVSKNCVWGCSAEKEERKGIGDLEFSQTLGSTSAQLTYQTICFLWRCECQSFLISGVFKLFWFPTLLCAFPFSPWMKFFPTHRRAFCSSPSMVYLNHSFIHTFSNSASMLCTSNSAVSVQHYSSHFFSCKQTSLDL